MVTLEVVVKDHKSQHVTGLKPEDFQLFEQTPDKNKEKREQKIVAFREVSVADLLRQANSEVRPPAGVYTNALAPQKDPVPPTIILMDGINTDIQYQMQVHGQMVRLLRQLPSDVPVAVFLLGRRLVLLQDFTTDPKLLQAAARKALSIAGHGLAQVDPRNDANSPDNLLVKAKQGMPGSGSTADTSIDLPGPALDMFEALDSFGSSVYNMQMDRRVHETADALEAIARHLSGYPGRKNLLWISTAFPICVDPALDSVRQHVYNRDVEKVTDLLSDAKIAVYPINPAGVLDSVDLQEIEESNRKVDTMRLMAAGTGGEVCTGDNFVWDCVHRAVEDGNRYYEIAYYPDSIHWDGEYRRIILSAKTKGLHLEYRQGYFATPEGQERMEDAGAALKQAACEGALDATSILLTAKSLPSDSPDGLKFNLGIDASTLTFTPTENGGSELNMQIAVCTFDRKGNPGEFVRTSFKRKMTEREMQRAAASGLQDIAAVPGPKPDSLRLAVMDVPSGRIGSLRIQMDPVTTLQK
jgi:VWFA-related protein